MYNSINFIVKTEVLLEQVRGELLPLFEAELGRPARRVPSYITNKSKPDVNKGKPDKKETAAEKQSREEAVVKSELDMTAAFMRSKNKKKITQLVNNSFLSSLSVNKPFTEYIKKRYGGSQELTMLILQAVNLYSADGETKSKPKLNDFILGMYMEFIKNTYLSSKGFFGTRTLITGNKTLDNIISVKLHNSVDRAVKGKNNPLFNYIGNNIQASLKNNQLLKNGLSDNVKSMMNEGLMSSINLWRLKRSIKALFAPLNNSTLKEIDEVFKNVDVGDVSQIAKGGKSVTVQLMSEALMIRTAKMLDAITIDDKIIDELLKAISSALLTKSPEFYDPLKKGLDEYIDIRLEYLRKNKNIFNNTLSHYSGRATRNVKEIQ